jgi:hypothetical protein
MDWLLFHMAVCAFCLVLVPYSLYSGIYLYLSSYAVATSDLVYHLLIMIHGIAIVLYLQWIPRESTFFRSHPAWEWFRKDYFSFKVYDPHKVLEDKETQYIVAIHPHGVYSSTLDLYFALNPEMIRYKAVATSILFKIPLLKELAGMAGAIPANRSDMLTALSCRDSLALCPGGVREAGNVGNQIVKRMGFLKISMHAQVRKNVFIQCEFC